MKAEAQQITIAKACGWRMVEGLLAFPPIELIKRRFPPEVLAQIACVDYEQIPDYLNDLNAAVDFAAHLTTMGWRCQMNNGLDTTWECEFFRPIQPSTHEVNIGEMDGEKMEIHYGCGDTLAVAICQAGLQAIGKFVEE